MSPRPLLTSTTEQILGPLGERRPFVCDIGMKFRDVPRC